MRYNARMFQFSLKSLFMGLAVFSVVAAAVRAGGVLGFSLAALVISAVLETMARCRGRAAVMSLLWWTALASLGLLVWCLLPSVGSKPIGRRAQCLNNLMQLGQALHQYEAEQGGLPPVHTLDVSRAPLCSWRTLILPYLEQTEMYQRYHQEEPWNSENNNRISKVRMEIWRCPSDDSTFIHESNTSYVAVVGPHTAWHAGSGVKRGEIKDSLADTILLVEMKYSEIGWAEPRDLDLDQLPPGVTKQNLLHSLSNHAGGVNVLFADGSVRFIREDIPWEDFEAMLTIDGGEKVDRDK
jgi:prepilin-type processing-associated H-X9-DG protein